MNNRDEYLKKRSREITSRNPEYDGWNEGDLVECPNCKYRTLKQSARADWCDNCGYSQGY